MTLTTEDSLIIHKTKELCQTILDHPDFESMKRQIDAFMSDEEAKEQYQNLIERGEALNVKQQQGVRLTTEEIADFEQHREAVVNDPVAKGFLDAQQAMQKVQESVGQYVTKTFELGRVPQDEDLGSGSCGHGCGCH
ncbi:MAG: YlbF family regulator [Verrucomicrobiota bacterium]